MFARHFKTVNKLAMFATYDMLIISNMFAIYVIIRPRTLFATFAINLFMGYFHTSLCSLEILKQSILRR